MDEFEFDLMKTDYEWHHDLWRVGYLSDDEWVAYCRQLLEKLMKENADVLIRLKER